MTGRHGGTRRNLRRTLAALALLAAAWPAPGHAQEGDVPRAAVGAGLGVLGGVGVTVATVVARAHLQGRYLHEPADLIHWQSAPMLLGPAAGVVFGLHSREALVGSLVGSLSGVALGGGVGAVVGALLVDTPEGPWAGATIGGGLGLAIGGLLGGYIGWREHDDRAAPVALELRVPISRILPGGPP